MLMVLCFLNKIKQSLMAQTLYSSTRKELASSRSDRELAMTQRNLSANKENDRNRDGSADKSTNSSFTGPEFSSQQACFTAHNSLNL